MGTKYSSQSAVGYNSNPVSDDGSATEANKVKASTILTKWTNPLKTFIEAVNTAISTALDKSARAVTGNDNSAATDHDRTIQVNTASVTITLADATTMAAGYTVSVANQSSGDITVALATATDTIDTVTNATQTISAKEVRRYIVNATATGYVTASDRVVAASATIAGKVELATVAEILTGTDTARAMTPGDFAGNKSLAANGYYKFPGGLIIQWFSGATHSTPGTGTNHNLPVAFASAVYGGVACITQNISSGSPHTVALINPTTTTITSQADVASLNFFAIVVGV